MSKRLDALMAGWGEAGDAEPAAVAPGYNPSKGGSNTLSQFAQGVAIDFPAGVIGLAELAERGARYMGSAVPQGEPTTFSGAKARDIFSRLASDKLGLDVAEPYGRRERVARAAGSLAPSIPFTPGGVAGRSLAVAGGSAGVAATEAGAGPVVSAGADIATSLIARDPRGLARSAAAFPREARAARYVRGLRLGKEGAEDARRGLQDKMLALADEESAAWSDPALAGAARVDPKPLVSAADDVAFRGRLNPSDVPAIANTIPRELGSDVGLEDVRSVLRALSSTSREVTRGNLPEAQIAGVGRIRDAAEETLRRIESASAQDAASVVALREARASSARLHGQFPETSAVHREVFSAKAGTNPQEAFDRILNSRTRLEEVALIQSGLAGDPAGQRGFRRAFIDSVLKSSEETAQNKAGAMLGRFDKYGDVADVVLGADGAKQFRRLLAESSRSDPTGGAARLMFTQSGLRVAEPVTMGGLGMVVGGPKLGAALAVMSMVRSRYGPKAVREMALASLYDQKLYEKLTRPLTGANAQTHMMDLMASLARRGIIEQAPYRGPKEEQRP